MPAELTIAAVGDIMMRGKLILAAQLSCGRRYCFDEMFEKVAPYLTKADLTIGNLETTFAGAAETSNFTRQKRNPNNGYPLFTCPDELGAGLSNAGFDVMITANNHCMDYGIRGLKRTLNVLDRYRIAHTGTFRTYEESQRFLIRHINGIEVGILAYTLGTNSIPVPENLRWAVNRIDRLKMIADLQQLKRKADFVIVCIHAGQEYRLVPDARQQRLVQLLFKHGVDLVLGAHPHVVQPAVFKKITDIHGVSKKRFAIYSLGTLITTRLKRNDNTKNGVIAQISIRKNDRGIAEVSRVSFVPTWVVREKVNNRTRYQIVPLHEALSHPPEVTEQEIITMRTIYDQVTKRLKMKNATLPSMPIQQVGENPDDAKADAQDSG